MPSRLLRITCAAALAFAALTSVAAGQEPKAARVAVSGTVGLFLPTDSGVSDVYGAAHVPIAGQVELRVAPRVWVFGGIRWVRATGQAVTTESAGENFQTILDLAAFRFGTLFVVPVARRLDLSAGVGISLTKYDESSPDTAFAESGHATGFMIQAEARRILTAKWSVIGRFEYATITATPVDLPAVNLGGVDVQAGARFAF